MYNNQVVPTKHSREYVLREVKIFYDGGQDVELITRAYCHSVGMQACLQQRVHGVRFSDDYRKCCDWSPSVIDA